MAAEYDWLLNSVGPMGDVRSLFELGRKLEQSGDLGMAATAYDRTFSLQPDSEQIKNARQALLDRLEVVEHGIVFRYIPAGSFLMGSETGEQDEQPVHRVQLSQFWISETPVSWAVFCDLMDWAPAPYSVPKQDGMHFQGDGKFTGKAGWFLREENKIRLQYCEDATIAATDWHAHAPEHEWVNAGRPVSSRVLFGTPAREDPCRPWRYDRKPMVSVSWAEAEEMCGRISNTDNQYRLPTEAEWEKAARGGLIGAPYPWGIELPSEERCDFDRFGQFSILPMKRFPPNGYGLYAVSGCIWEWTSDWYDAEYYKESVEVNPTGPIKGDAKVLRGGSWADCAEVVTVSFRMSRVAGHWRKGWGGHFTPNVGFRLCRVGPVPGK